jgi:hypothetical protein
MIQFPKTSQVIRTVALILLSVFAATSPLRAAWLKVSANSMTRAAGEVEGNYTTTHVFINEDVGEQVPFTIFFDPQMLGVETAEVFTNLNRRDRAGFDANGDSIHDGIKPVPGNLIAAGSDAHYYKAYTMTPVSGGYQFTLNADKTGM